MFEWINDTPYTCPLLMAAQQWLCCQKWRYCSSGWVLMKQPNSRAQCMWPKWLVMIETKMWGSVAGMRLRRLCGSQQREYRLNTQRNTADCS